MVKIINACQHIHSLQCRFHADFVVLHQTFPFSLITIATATRGDLAQNSELWVRINCFHG